MTLTPLIRNDSFVSISDEHGHAPAKDYIKHILTAISSHS